MGGNGALKCSPYQQGEQVCDRQESYDRCINTNSERQQEYENIRGINTHEWGEMELWSVRRASRYVTGKNPTTAVSIRTVSDSRNTNIHCINTYEWGEMVKYPFYQQGEQDDGEGEDDASQVLVTVH
jgi:hypothetical protein